MAPQLSQQIQDNVTASWPQTKRKYWQLEKQLIKATKEAPTVTNVLTEGISAATGVNHIEENDDHDDMSNFESHQDSTGIS